MKKQTQHMHSTVFTDYVTNELEIQVSGTNGIDLSSHIYSSVTGSQKVCPFVVHTFTPLYPQDLRKCAHCS